MKVWKKNLVAAAVLAAVCAGIYLNWSYSEEQAAVSLSDTLDSNKILSTDMLVFSSDADDVLTDAAPVNTYTDYFAAIRLSRQESRDSAVTLLQEAMAYSSEGKDASSAQHLDQIVETALCEAQIESLVIAKGYADCVAYIGEEGISVAVASPEGGLQQEDIAVIADVVLTQTDYTMEDIRIVEVQ